MKGLLFFILFIFQLLVSCVIVEVRAGEDAAEEKKNLYVVYMGAARESLSREQDHIQVIASVLERKEEVEERIVHTYKHGFSGFVAHLSKQEADAIAGIAGVVSVFLDPIYKLHTTRSWDFLQYQNNLEIDSSTPTTTSTSSSNLTTDTIIGLLDTGIWPESESFKDDNMGSIPRKWKGVCMEGHDFSASNCNRKLIGARYYNDMGRSKQRIHDLTPRDDQGHGTHTASTAAGNSVSSASYYGLAVGTAKGGSPGSRIAVYKVCTSNGCRGSSIMAAFDDAIADGVDVLSLSLGASSFNRLDFANDPIAVGAFHAVENGITVVCSAGNEGPNSGSVVNAAPWILTVGASTIDRDFESDVVLGGNKVIKGEAVNFSNLQKSPIYPLINAISAKTSSSSDDEARHCNPDSLDGAKVKGKIVLCEHSEYGFSKREKMEGLKNLGGFGLVLIDDLEKAVASTYGSFPMTIVSSKEAAEILSYINSTRNPVATVLPTVSVNKYKPAPIVPYFTARGPSALTANVLKPDITAPGVNILAAWIINSTSEVPIGQKPSQFNLLSGTSMSCPHVSGIAATIKSINPSWSPSEIKSAIMTTATQENNEKAPFTTDLGTMATPYDYGSGEISPSGALQPGLVYETNKNDYWQFLCNYGYPVTTIKLISNVTNGFACPKNSSTDLISELNYPSIAISKFDGKKSRKVSRTVTNVGTENETLYTVSLNSPQGLDVNVVPDKLQFTKSIKKLSYQVIFSASSSVEGNLFGSITWTNGKYKVRTPFVVTST